MTFTDASGDDLDVSWATIYFTVRKRTDLHDEDDADVLIKKTIAIPASPATNTANLTLDVNDTDQEAWTHDREIVIKFSWSDIRISKDYGKFTIEKALTKVI